MRTDTMRKHNLYEQNVLALYEQHESARVVAEAMGCSANSVYNVLKRHGVPRTHRHEKVCKYTSGCKTKYCNALVVLLRRHTDMTFTEICHFTMYPKNAVSSIINRRCPETKMRRVYKSDVDIERLKHEYADLGITSYELSDKYGVNAATICKWMRQEGVYIGRENASSRITKQGHYKGAATLKNRMRERIVQKLKDDGDTLELLDHDSDCKILLRCKVCGTKFVRCKGGYQHVFTCSTCHEEQLERMRQKRAYREKCRKEQLKAAYEWRLSVPRTCKECGEPFYSVYDNACYCSDMCRNKARNRKASERSKRRGHSGSNSYKRRMRIRVTASTYDRSVTLASVYKKFGGRCCSCSRKTYRTKQYTPSQATLDHIVALANNGTHTWDNVQLLCNECNSAKRDTGQMRLAIEEVSYA